MLKKYIFLIHFETCQERVFKAFSVLQSVHFSRLVVSDSAGVHLQQPGIHLKGGTMWASNNAASQFSWTAHLFQVKDFLL